MTLVLFSRSQPFYFTARCYASAVLAMALCPSVSVTSRCSIETAGRIELVFGMWASFQPSYTVLKGNSVISKTKGTSLWKFLNSGLRKFRHGISIVETCYQLSSRKVDAQSVINWTVVRQLSRKYLRRSTTIVYRTDRQACLQHDFVARVNYRQLILGSGLVVQVVSALLHGNWQNFNWHDASRGPSAIAELLVFFRTDYMDSPDCSLLLLNISIFTF